MKTNDPGRVPEKDPDTTAWRAFVDFLRTLTMLQVIAIFGAMASATGAVFGTGAYAYKLYSRTEVMYWAALYTGLHEYVISHMPEEEGKEFSREWEAKMKLLRPGPGPGAKLFLGVPYIVAGGWKIRSKVKNPEAWKRFERARKTYHNARGRMVQRQQLPNAPPIIPRVKRGAQVRILNWKAMGLPDTIKITSSAVTPATTQRGLLLNEWD